MSMKTENKNARILLVEDNPGDVLLFQEFLNRNKGHHELIVAEDGEEALQYLRQEGKFKNTPIPDLIVLDLNLPKIDGFEVLAQCKQAPIWKRIPVIILSSSPSESDIRKSYDMHANCYITKRVDIHQFEEAIKTIKNFWFETVTLSKD